MNNHVGKPFDLDRLGLLLRVSGHAAPRPAAAAPPRPRPRAGLQTATTAAQVDLAAALQRLGSKTAVYERMLRNG
jgi:hypothetical protein